MKLGRFALLFGSMLLLLAGSVGCSKEEAGVTAKSPDEAVERLARGLADGRPEVTWQALPPSYRKDVTELIHSAAAKMDPEIWDRSFSLVQKLTQLARDKREFILEQPMLAQNNGDKKELEAGWKAVVGILDTVANSELSSLQELQRLDVEEFLAGTGSKLMDQIADAAALAPDDSWKEQMSRLRRTEATVVSESGETAVIRVERPGAPPLEEPYVQIEGHWIPKKIADEWSSEIAKARQQIDEISTEYMAQNKASVLMQLSMVEGAVDQLLQTESREQFDAALGPIMGMAMGAMMAQASRSSSVQSTPGVASPFEEVEGGPPLDLAEEPTEPSPEIALTMPSEPRAVRRDAALEAGSHELHEPGEVRFDHAHLYVGQWLRVSTHDGLSMISRLKEARPDALVFERSLHGGTAVIEVTSDEIDSLRSVER